MPPSRPLPRKPGYIFLACAAGASYSLVGIAYQLGRGHGLTPQQVMAVGAIMAAGFFLGKLIRQVNISQSSVVGGQLSVKRGIKGPLRGPALVWACGILSGLSQYALLRLFALGLDLGPLSPVWIAASLGFIPVILFATWRFHERLGGRRLLAVLAAVACIVLPELVRTPGGRAAGPAGGIMVLYPLVLVLITLANSIQLGSIKLLGSLRSGPNGTYMDRHGTLFMFLANASLALAAAIDLGLTGIPAAPLPWLSAMGALVGLGSILGISLLSACARGPAALIFTSSGVSSILGAALVSVFFFGESADFGWFIMLGMSILAIMLGASSPPSGRGLNPRKGRMA